MVPVLLYGVDLKELGFTVSQKKYLVLTCIVLMMFLVLMIHELGHLLTGLVQGFRFEMFVIGPIGFKREDDRVKVYFNKNLEYYGGIAATSPRDGSPNNAKRFARILIAGPVASVLFALYCVMVAYLMQDAVFHRIFLTGAAISVAIFLVTTIPSKTGIFYTDRKRYQRLVRPGKAQDVELAILNIMGKYAEDNSYKNINTADIHTLINDDTPFTQYFGLFNLVCYQLEMEGSVNEEVQKEYELKGSTVSKHLVGAFDKEIDKLREKHAVV